MKSKECPSCAMDVPNKAKECPICGYEFAEHSPAIKWVAILLIMLMLFYLIF